MVMRKKLAFGRMIFLSRRASKSTPSGKRIYVDWPEQFLVKMGQLMAVDVSFDKDVVAQSQPIKIQPADWLELFETIDVEHIHISSNSQSLLIKIEVVSGIDQWGEWENRLGQAFGGKYQIQLQTKAS